MRKRKRDAQALLPPAVQIAAIAALAILVLIPIAYTLLLSVTPDVEIGGASLIPSYWAFGNYLQMWSTVSLVQGLSNSLIIAGIASVIAVILSVGAAYIITRFRFRGRRLYLYSLIGLQTVPSVMLLLPLFVLFASVLTSPETRTLAVQLQDFSAAQEGGALPLYGQLMGAAVVSALPVVILYMIFQRYLIGGLTAGGVKG